MFNDVTTKYDLSDATWEIFIMLLGAFILGYLLRYFLEKMAVPAEKESMLPYLGKEYAEDDLKIVEGIGPKIESLLKERGIINWCDLADTSTDTLRDILKEAGDRYKMHKPDTWAEQASLACKYKWQELKEYQDFLVGGV